MTAPSKRPLSALSTTAFKVAAAAVVVFVLAAIIIVAFLIRQTNTVLTNEVVKSLNAEARLLEAETRGGGMLALRRAVRARANVPGAGLYLLQAQTGGKLAGNLSRLPPEIAQSSTGGVFYYIAPGDDTNSTRMAVAISSEPYGGRLILGRDVEDLRSLAARIRWSSLIGFGALAIAGIVMGLAVSRFVLRRIDSMTKSTKAIMAGDLSQRLPMTGMGDELDGLTQNLNQMLARIEQLMHGMREVSDNIAHDLKTPLNRLRVKAEAALRDPRGPEAHKEGLEQTIEAADDIIKTFNALLLIARLEAGAFDETVEPIDIAVLVGDVAELYEPVAEEAGLVLSVDLPAELPTKGNRQLVGQAVANLIDNAIKYSSHLDNDAAIGNGHEPTVRVTAGKRGGRIEIVVADRGPGISRPDRKRVLDRFVRLEKSRTTPGTGLGLSLVAAVARLHNGEFSLADNGPGLKTILALPQISSRPQPQSAMRHLDKQPLPEKV